MGAEQIILMATPKCSYFNICNGCSSQHIDYSVQLKNKRDVLARAIKFEDIQIFYDSEYGYRNRIELIFRRYGQRNVMGFRLKNNADEILEIDNCPICNEKVNALIGEIRKKFRDVDFYDSKKGHGTFMYAIVRATDIDSAICFVLNEKSSSLNDAVQKIRNFNTSADNLVVSYLDEGVFTESFAVKGEGLLHEDILDKRFVFSAHGFFQNNTNIARKMHKYINEIIEKEAVKDSMLLDLYAGVGTFGIINSHFFRKVFIVESFPDSIKAAETNIKENKCNNAEAILLDADKIRRLNMESKVFIITDPPRTGMSIETINALNTMKPEKMIYISCNPLQLSKDLMKIKCMKIKSAALFDMFPQTNHSEAVILLERI